MSLFSGIGGFETALNRLGGKCVMASEIDKFANQAYELLYGMETVGDITKVEAESVPDHDLLTAGFPCQSFSLAGKRLGFEDTRGTLFFEIARIAQTKKPKVLLLENVKGLINHGKGETFNTMVQVLCDIGYTVDFEVLNSKYFGVPQNRERVFIVAIRDDLVTPEPWVIEGNTVVPKGKRRIQELEGVKTFNFDWPPQEIVTKRLRDILESNVDERFYLSEEKTAKLVEQLEHRNEPQVLRPQRTEYGKQIRKEYEAGYIDESRHNMTELQPRKDEICNTLTSVQKDNLLAEPQLSQVGYIYDANGVGATVASQTGGSGVTLVKDTPNMLGLLDMKGNESVRRVYGTEGVSPTLTTMGGGHREPKVAELQQFSNGKGISHAIDANYTKGTSPGDVGKGRRTHVIEFNRSGIGRELDVAYTLNSSDWRGLNRNQKQNAVLEEIRPVIDVGRLVKTQNGCRFKDNGKEAFTIMAQDRHGVAIGNYPKYRIRKLTPLECFRLQAFPDKYHKILSANGISNSQLYKMAGNAVTVSVIDAIGKRLLPYL